MDSSNVTVLTIAAIVFVVLVTVSVGVITVMAGIMPLKTANYGHSKKLRPKFRLWVFWTKSRAMTEILGLSSYFNSPSHFGHFTAGMPLPTANYGHSKKLRPKFRLWVFWTKSHAMTKILGLSSYFNSPSQSFRSFHQCYGETAIVRRSVVTIKTGVITATIAVTRNNSSHYCNSKLKEATAIEAIAGTRN
jgi:hypothetical protein